MKHIVFIVAVLISGLRLPAQTNAPIRLALMAESADVSAAADVLTAELSGRQNVQLLERNEIGKVYREQGLSAGNQDYVKLGQILGADGLLLLEPDETGTNVPANIPFAVERPQTLKIRLVAIKPGVVLMAENFSVPAKDLPAWSSSFAGHLDLFLPKLAVLAKDAIPISVVNLRSAVASTEASETERQLKTLAIQRLSREPRIFVLERQRMQLLNAEKELNADESAFWNGSYLLEGVVDQNGYARETITVNARLTPPKGGAPLLFEASGSRTNLTEVINQLAVKMNAALNVNSTMKEWNAADEAGQYFGEAQWALRWGIYSEAQMAAESAWALGKRDLDCAVIRVRAYLSEVPKVAAPNVTYFLNGKRANFVSINEPPDPQSCATALYALNCYYEFCRSSPAGEPKILSRGKGWNDWHNSDWYQLGLDALAAASSVLQHFNHVPESQKPVAGELAELRGLARSVARLIAAAPSVHDSYFVGDRVVTRDELSHTIEENPNIFRCEVNWGCFWQERPEDGVALYRDLMSSPVFRYIHNDFWRREAIQPRLIAWNEADQNRVPQVWGNFVRELSASTNVLFRMEAQALAMTDAPNPAQAQLAQQAWWGIVRSNRDELVANNVELFYLGWGLTANPETEAMDQEYWSKTIPAQKTLAAFEKQKQFLAESKPYDFFEFDATFREKNYSKAQALEIQPLLAAYKSNLVAQSQAASPMQRGQLRGGIFQVGYLEGSVNRLLNPPAPVSPPSVPSPPPTNPVISQPALAASRPTDSVATPAPEMATNVLLVKKFLPIPLEGLPGDKISAVTITAHHWLEGKLVLDFQYGAFVYAFDEKGNWQSTRNATFPAIAILDPATEHWQVIGCPAADVVSQNRFYHHTTLCRGEVFTSEGGQIKKYDAVKNAWQVLDIPEVGNCELFTVAGRLYAATTDLIVEILDGGNRTHILASNRRQPPVSALDTENLGTPVLFAGPDQSLRAVARNKIVTWDGADWRNLCPAPETRTPPLISDDGILFLGDGWNAPAGIWHLAKQGDHVEFWLGQAARRQPGAPESGMEKTANPAWKLPPQISLARLPAASRGQDLYLLADHAKPQDIVNEQEHLVIGKKILPQNGYHAGLLCFSGSDPAPQKILLKFDGEDTSLPVTGDNHPAGFVIPNLPAAWLLFSTNYLFCGRETFGAISSGGGDPRISRPQTGVWLIPVAQIDPEIVRQKKAQQAQSAQSDVLATQAAETLRKKYDLNHNGVIDPVEREAALTDPAFIEAELDLIDTNHNGRLEADELAWFDANQDQILEPNEQDGIEHAQRLLAERLLKQFDANGDGWLDRSEFNEWFQSSRPAGTGSGLPGSPFTFMDKNHDGHLDMGELQSFLEQQTRTGLRSPGMPGNPAYFNGMRMGASQPVDARQNFKAAVESYWQHPVGDSIRPPFQNGMLPGPGWGPAGMPKVSGP